MQLNTPAVETAQTPEQELRKFYEIFTGPEVFFLTFFWKKRCPPKKKDEEFRFEGFFRSYAMTGYYLSPIIKKTWLFKLVPFAPQVLKSAGNVPCERKGPDTLNGRPKVSGGGCPEGHCRIPGGDRRCPKGVKAISGSNSGSTKVDR